MKCVLPYDMARSYGGQEVESLGLKDPYKVLI